MKYSLTSEIKTLLHSKLFYISLSIITVISIIFMVQNYQSANANINYLLNMYNEFTTTGTEFDYNEIVTPITDYFYTYNPNLAINNSISILIGIGLLIFPTFFSIYVGNDYKKRTIRNKIIFSSLPKVIISKYIVLILTQIIFLIIYTLIHYGLSIILYNKYLSCINLPSDIIVNNVNFNLIKNLKGIVAVFMSLIFYISLCMVISYIFKSGIAGVVMTLIINFVTLPTKFSPHNVIYYILNKYLYISESSPVTFSLKYYFQNKNFPFILLLIYIISIFLIQLFISKIQKN